MSTLPDQPIDYIWQEQFWAALIETKTARMQEHIRKARDAMRKRLEVLAIRQHQTALQEYNAIRDAEALLKMLERNSA